MVKAIFFDMVGPLLRKRLDYVPNELAEEVERFWRESGGLEEGLIKKLKTDKLTKDIDIGVLAEAVVDKYQKIDQVWGSLLPRLKPKYKMAIINNGPGFTVPYFEKQFQLSKYFKHFINSSIEGVAKPNRGIFELACHRLAVLPEESVFIDDNEVNVSGAEVLGMKGVVYLSFQQLGSELGRIL